jgi:O-antigen ligase
MEAAQPLGRVAIWRSSLRMAREHPLLGVGMDAFEAAYTRYDGSAGMYRIEQAHNDYLQLLTDFGIAGALLGLLFIGIFFVRAFRALGDANKYLVLARNVSYGEQVTHRAQILGALTGCVGMLIHSCFDFNLHIPSNALLFLCLAAIATSENFAN